MRSRLVLARVSGGIQRLFQLPAGDLGGFPQIRARLLHETGERERGKPQAFGVELSDGLAKPLTLMQRLRNHWRRRLGCKILV